MHFHETLNVKCRIKSVDMKIPKGDLKINTQISHVTPGKYFPCTDWVSVIMEASSSVTVNADV